MVSILLKTKYERVMINFCSVLFSYCVMYLFSLQFSCPFSSIENILLSGKTSLISVKSARIPPVS
jgi:hypothetical protein